jgi:hypothetical protein
MVGRQGSFHEVRKQRHCEGSIAMRRAVDHAFFDESRRKTLKSVFLNQGFPMISYAQGVFDGSNDASLSIRT